MNNHKNEIPWYKWQFSLAGFFLILFSLFMVFIFLRDSITSLPAKIIGILFFLILFSILGYFEWKFRKSNRKTFKDDNGR